MSTLTIGQCWHSCITWNKTMNMHVSNQTSTYTTTPLCIFPVCCERLIYILKCVTEYKCITKLCSVQWYKQILTSWKLWLLMCGWYKLLLWLKFDVCGGNIEQCHLYLGHCSIISAVIPPVIPLAIRWYAVPVK